MPRHVSTTAFPAGTRVEMFAPGSQRPDPGTNGEEHKTVKKNGHVVFEVKGDSSLVGRTVWLAGDVDGTWVTTSAPVKDGKAEDAEHPGETLARVAAPAQTDTAPIAGARTTTNTRHTGVTQSGRGRVDPNEKLAFASVMSGGEALRVSASGSFVSIPDGSSADPAAHEPVVPAHTDGLTPEERDKLEHDEAKPRAKSKSAQQESEKTDSGQPTRNERTIDKPIEEPDPAQRTAL